MTTAIKPIALQLYSLREEAARDFPDVLRRVAKMGYKGVESAGFFDFEPAEFRRFVEDLGMVVTSTHTPSWAWTENLNEVIDVCGVLGVRWAVGGYNPADFKDLNQIKITADKTEKIRETLAAAGLTLAVHNHGWEFEKIDGRLKYEIFAELCPAAQFELDTYWAANFGENDPVEMVKKFRSRSPLLHIKDGPLIRPESRYNPEANTLEPVPGAVAPLLPVGSGKLDFPGIISAMDPEVTEWLVVEQDRSETDMFEAVASSYDYLTTSGLAAGNR